MKNTFKVLGIIGLLLVIGFSMAACGGDDGGGSGGSGGSSGGGNIVSGVTVTYPAGIADADKPIDFSFVYNGRTAIPISNYINEPASVTISGGKLNIKLGTPKDQYLVESNSQSDVTVTPSDAKIFAREEFICFTTADAKYFLICMKNTSAGASLAYADKDVTIKGTRQYSKGEFETWNASLKKGWNYLINSGGEKGSIGNYTSSVSLPSGFTWTLLDEAGLASL